jgi:hypothetical protein
MLCPPSLTVAPDPSPTPTLRFAMLSSGIVTAVSAARAIPTQLVDACVLPKNVLLDSTTM